MTTLCSAVLGMTNPPQKPLPVASHLVGAIKKIGPKVVHSNKIRNFQYNHVPYEMIVKFKDHMSTNEIEDFLKPHHAHIVHRYSSNGAFLIRVAKSDMAAIASQWADAPAVDYIEANMVISLESSQNGKSIVPNDFQFGDLWGLNNSGQTNGLIDADIDAPEAWEISTGSKNVLSAVIDTGIDYKHGDLAANYWKNPGESGLDAEGKAKETNGIDDDGNGYVDDFRGWDFVSNDNDPMDDHGHGSHCAGTIAGVGNNEKGITGINWNTSIVGIKFLDASGSGSLDQAVLAIEYATKLGVHLTSNSWGGGGFSETMHAAISQARDKGILFVAAAGNDGQNNDLSPTYPASYDIDNVISVAALDDSDQMAKFSNYGQQTVHVGAPGVDILSTVIDQKYELMSGTSMAAPHVSGVVALVKSQYPNETYDKIRHRILFSSDVVPATASKTISGGRLNAFHALEQDEVSPAKVSGVTISKLGLNSVEITFDAVGDDGLEGQARAYELVYLLSQDDTTEQPHGAQEALQRIAFHLPGKIAPGQSIKALISDLPFESQGTVKVRAFDSAGNSGEFSDPVSFELPKIYTFYRNTAQTLAGVEADSPWGLELVGADPSDASSFSDSPGKEYRSNAKTSLTIKSISLPSTASTFVKLKADASLEENFDFVFTEVSFDQGKTWTKIGAITGRHMWSEFIFELPRIPERAKDVFLRLRLETDYSVVDDGIKVDEISLFTQSNEG